MAIAFISDLHLMEEEPAIAQLFLRFLEGDARHLQALYILGDFFETWIGDDDQAAFNQMIIKALRQAVDQGLPIFMLHGNRDFLLGKRFFRASGCQRLPEESVIDLFGVPTLLMHGDTLCTRDVAYLRFRKKARHWLWQRLFLCKTLAARKKIAAQYRMMSQAHVQTLESAIMDVTQDEVERVMHKHGVTRLIHGHTHRRGQHTFPLRGMEAKRIVLGAWHEKGNAWVCQSPTLQSFTDII